jgi:hypothetical protein
MRIGGRTQQATTERGDAVELAVRQEPQLLELARREQVRFVDCHDDSPSALMFLGGEVVHGLGDQAGGVEPGDAAEAGDQRGVEAAGADGGVR